MTPLLLLALSGCPVEVWYTDEDEDGVPVEEGDCDDEDAATHPGATEVKDDGIDNDCDGLTDCDDPDTTGEWEGDLGESDLPGFCDRFCTRSVTGRVRLHETSLTDLADLSCLTAVGGDFAIRSNESLVSLAGLENLVSVGGDFSIGFVRCDWAAGPGTCEGYGNPVLASLGDLGNLASIGGWLFIADNPALVSAPDFDSLAAVGSGNVVELDGLWIAANPSLAALPAFPSLTRVNGGLWIWDDDGLTSLHGLENLTSVYLEVAVLHNDGLATMAGLDNLASTECFWAEGNASLTSLDGLDALSETNIVALRDNPNLTSVEALSRLTQLGYLDVTENDALTSLEGLEGLTMAYLVWIEGNDALASLAPLGGLTEVYGPLYVDGNSSLTTLTGLDAIVSVGGDLTIGDVANLDGNVGNANLVSLEGLGGLEEVGSTVAIGGNPALASLSGVETLTTVGWDLLLRDNVNLADVTALYGLARVVERVTITGNASLTDSAAEALIAEIDSIGGTVTVSGNEPSPVGSGAPPDLPPPPVGGGLGDHEAYDDVAEVATSTHFALKWGPDWEPEAGWAGMALDALESTYAWQVVDLGFEEPYGMSVARFNVYVANTGVTDRGTPLRIDPPTVSYFSFDPEKWPMVCVPDWLWGRDLEWARDGVLVEGDLVEATLAHEFHHATQSANGAGLFTDSWWLEGLATWAQEQQVRGSITAWMFLPWLYEVPEPAFETGYWLADGWTAEESAQLANRWNATFLLPWYVSEELGRTDLLVEWARWVGSDLNPMGSLDDLLAGEGEDLGAVMIDLWAGVQSRRFEDPDLRTWIEDFWTYWGKPASLHHNPTAVLEVGADAVSPPEAWRPERFGANVLRVESPEDDLLFTLEPDASGSEGTPVRWGAAAVLCTGDVCEDEVLGEAGNSGWAVAAAGADLVDLVLVPITGDYTEGETFGYRVSARPNAEEPGGCGCGVSHRPTGTALPLALLLLVARRRRERAPPI